MMEARIRVIRYMDLAMNGRDEATKVKLFLYSIGSQGREIYDTKAFEVPALQRSFSNTGGRSL